MRKLGKSNRTISAMGMGCWGIGGAFQNEHGDYLAYGEVDDKESVATIHTALDLGINLFDTADVYGCGHSERILGQAFQGYERENIVIATKFGSTFDEKTKRVTGKKFSEEYIKEAIDASLKRLQTDYIDIYLLHNARHNGIDALRIRDILENLVEEGKIRYYGWSTDDPERMKQFSSGKHCITVQYILHMLRANTAMIKLCDAENLVSIIRQPIQSGLFSGKYNTTTKRDPKHFYGKTDFSIDYYQRIFAAIDQMKELIQKYDLTMIQATIGYIWAKNDQTFPIPGAKTVQQITENASCLDLGPISNSLVKEIDSIFMEQQSDFSYETFPYYKQQ